MTAKGANKDDSGRSLAISKKMSSPKVQISGTKVSGVGLALVGVPVEQDAAYWEWHIDGTESEGEKFEEYESDAPKFGVATKKDAKFYKALEIQAEDGDSTPEEDGTALMKAIPVLSGDTVGVAVQQSDLPMVQFLLNGEPVHDIAINRFRGTVYPSIFLREGLTVTAVFDEDHWQEMSPHARFGPLIAARGII